MIFSRALEALQEGKRVQRKGWNGKGLFVQIVKNAHVTSVSKDCEEVFEVEDFMVISTPLVDNYEEYRNNTWVPSSADLLAVDWGVLED